MTEFTILLTGEGMNRSKNKIEQIWPQSLSDRLSRVVRIMV